MFTNIQIELELSQPFKNPYQLSYPLYASLMTCFSENEINLLHQQNITSISQSIYQTKDKLLWEINCFNSDLLNSIMSYIKINKEVYIKRYKIDIKFKNYHVKTVTYHDLKQQVDRLIDQRSIRLFFHSTCSFKQSGHHLLFPSSQLIVQNLINRWNAHQPEKLHDVEINNLIKNSLTIDYFSIRKSDFFLKGIKISGFKGLLVFKSQLAYPLKRILLMLLVYGQYSGVGIKVALGMGHYKIVNEV